MNTQLSSTAPNISLGSPADLLSAVPYLLGYQPQDSVVLIGLSGDRITVTGRAPLPAPGDPLDQMATTARALRNSDVESAILVGYGPAERVTRCVDRLRDAIATLEVDLVEALRVTDGRYWSYLCEDLRCCPAEGTPLPDNDSTIAAEFTAAGAQVMPDREAVARQLEPVTGSARDAMTEATGRLLKALGHPLDDKLLRERGRAILDRCCDTDELPGPGDMAWLSVALTDSAMLDEAMLAIDRLAPDSDGTALWLWLTRHVESEYRAASAALLAYAAWRAGNGVLANESVDVALKADLNHRLAGVMYHILNNAIPPWSPMTPEAW